METRQHPDENGRKHSIPAEAQVLTEGAVTLCHPVLHLVMHVLLRQPIGIFTEGDSYML